MSKVFGEYHKLCADDEISPDLQYAIIIGGKLMATNREALIYGDIRNWLTGEENVINIQLNNIEGRAIHRDILQRMSMACWKKIRFNHDSIALYRSDENEEQSIDELHFYSGFLNSNELVDNKYVFTTFNRDGSIDSELGIHYPSLEKFTSINYESVTSVLAPMAFNLEDAVNLSKCFKACVQEKDYKLKFYFSNDRNEIIVKPNTPLEYNDIGLIMKCYTNED